MTLLKLLAIDSSAKSASVAIIDDNKILSECYVNNGLTHSRTLMPMVEDTIKNADITLNDIDCLAVNVGPGSFTGIRIGVATIKGLALPDDKKCCGVSTLESIAYNFTDENCFACCAMDARCNQVYCAIFFSENGKITRITDDNAQSIEQFLDDINLKCNGDYPVYLAGDGAALCYSFESKPDFVKLAGEQRRYQRASSTAFAALNNNEYISSSDLEPVYLRLPQAERELKLKKSEETK